MAEEEVKTSGERRFISFLEGLERRQDRGALATLRRSVGKETPDAGTLRLIAPFLPPGEGRQWRHRCYELVAELFALHPALGGAGNLGDTFKRLGDHESAQKRFVALLDSDADDLPHRLRQAVSLARSKEVPLNWLRLLKDLLHWDSEDRYVQYRWARAYWGGKRETANQPSATTAANEKEGE